MSQLDDLANAAISVWAFQLLPRSKKPAVPSFLRGDPPSKEELERHLAAGGNLAIRTGFIEGCSASLVVLDLDPAKPDKPAPEWTLEGKELVLPQCRIALPKTWVQRTGGGGLQLFFQVPPEDLIASVAGNAGAVAAGVDWRSFHNYVAVPPSVHPDTGKAYEWLQGQGPADLPEPAELPMELRELLLASKGSNRTRRTGIVPYSTGAAPTREDLETLRTKDGKPQLWLKPFLAMLKKAAARKGASPALLEAYGACSGEGDPPPKGQRHDALVRLGGTLACYLGDDPTATPEKVLALLCPYIEKIDSGTCDQDPFENAWKPINCFLAQAEAEAEEEEQELAERVQRVDAERAEILTNFRKNNPSIPVETIEDVFSKFLFIRDGNGNYCVLRPDGFYSSWTSSNSLRPEVEEHWAGRMFPVALVSETESGRQIERRASEIASGCSVRVNRDGCIYRLEVKGTTLQKEEQGFRVVCPRSCINWDLACWDETADAYLRTFFTPEHYDLHLRWNLRDLMFPKLPNTILNISGDPGTGKSMLARAHAETRYNFGGQLIASDKSFGRFSAELKGSAVTLISEEFQVPHPSVLRKVSKRILDIVSQGVDIEEKFRNVESIEDPTRLIVCANSDEIIKSLVAGIGTEAEEKAFADRVLSLTPRKEAEAFLRSIGNYEVTQRKGEEWIKGAKRLAGHLLALAKKAAEDPKLMAEISRERFGIPGNFAAGIHEAAFDDPDLQQVVQAICDWGETVRVNSRNPSGSTAKARPYAPSSLLVDGKVEITAYEIEAWIKNQGDRRIPERSKLRVILSRLAADPMNVFRTDKASRRKVFVLGLSDVLAVADDAGYPTSWADGALAAQAAQEIANSEEPSPPAAPPASSTRATVKTPPRPNVTRLLARLQKRERSPGGAAQPN